MTEKANVVAAPPVPSEVEVQYQHLEDLRAQLRSDEAFLVKLRADAEAQARHYDTRLLVVRKRLQQLDDTTEPAPASVVREPHWADSLPIGAVLGI